MWGRSQSVQLDKMVVKKKKDRPCDHMPESNKDMMQLWQEFGINVETDHSVCPTDMKANENLMLSVGDDQMPWGEQQNSKGLLKDS